MSKIYRESALTCGGELHSKILAALRILVEAKMESPDQFLSRPVQNFSATEETEIKAFAIQFLLLDKLSSSFRKKRESATKQIRRKQLTFKPYSHD